MGTDISIRGAAVVTGGAGYLGSHTVEALLARGYGVRVIDLDKAPFERNLGAVLGHDALTIDRRDILDIPPDDPVFSDVDYLFHCAGIADHVASTKIPETYMQVNVMAVVHVLEAARRNDLKKVIYPSSAAVYGIADVIPTPEDHPVNPENSYAFSKWMGEAVCQHWSQVFDVPTVSFRIFNGYGPRAETSGVVAAFLNRLKSNQPIRILGDGSARRDFIYVSDIVEAFILGAESEISGVIYNIGSGAPQTVKELAELVGGPIEYGPPREGEPPILYGDIGKITQHLNWKPCVSLNEGIKKTLANGV